jgi:hypothetical protein
LRRPEQRTRFRRKSLIQMTILQREHAATVASYTGSPEHKLPHARSDATLCPSDLGNQEELTLWLRNAITRGNAGGFMEGPFPRYVWYRDGDRLFEGRLTNRVLGEYKGYPISPDEGPLELRPQNV